MRNWSDLAFEGAGLLTGFVLSDLAGRAYVAYSVKNAKVPSTGVRLLVQALPAAAAFGGAYMMERGSRGGSRGMSKGAEFLMAMGVGSVVNIGATVLAEFVLPKILPTYYPTGLPPATAARPAFAF